MFKLSISSLVLRYYLMMVVGIIAVYTHQNWLILLTFLIAVSAIIGYRIEWPGSKEEGKVVRMEEISKEGKRKAG